MVPLISKWEESIGNEWWCPDLTFIWKSFRNLETKGLLEIAKAVIPKLRAWEMHALSPDIIKNSYLFSTKWDGVHIPYWRQHHPLIPLCLPSIVGQLKLWVKIKDLILEVKFNWGAFFKKLPFVPLSQLPMFYKMSCS